MRLALPRARRPRVSHSPCAQHVNDIRRGLIDLDQRLRTYMTRLNDDMAHVVRQIDAKTVSGSPAFPQPCAHRALA
jgi:hypothetical protein